MCNDQGSHGGVLSTEDPTEITAENAQLTQEVERLKQKLLALEIRNGSKTSRNKLQQFSFFLVARSGKLVHKTACPNNKTYMYEIKKLEFTDGLQLIRECS